MNRKKTHSIGKIRGKCFINATHVFKNAKKKENNKHAYSETFENIQNKMKKQFKDCGRNWIFVL